MEIFVNLAYLLSRENLDPFGSLVSRDLFTA
jgi:hypothetical protein